MSLDVSTFVEITATVQSGGVRQSRFGLGLLATTNDAIPAAGPNKVALYQNYNQVAEAFPSGDVLAAAAVWFAPNPQPKELYIGRWAPSNVPTELIGGDGIGTVAQLAIANASFGIGGLDVLVDLSGQASYAALAAAIGTAVAALAGIYVGSSVSYATDHFVIELAGDDAITGAALTAHSAGTGTDISGLLAMTAATVSYFPGRDAESFTAAAQEMVDLATAGSPVALVLSEDVPDSAGVPPLDTRTVASAFAQAGGMAFGYREIAEQALVANDAISGGALAYARQQSQVVALYTEPGKLSDIALLARMSSQNLDNPGSLLSPHGKALFGVETVNVTPTQAAELKRKRINVYTNVGGQPSLVGGYTSRDGYWLDATWWLLWLKNRMQTAIWGAIRRQNRLTYGGLHDVVTQVMRTGVRNGGLRAGGVVSAETRQDIITTTGNESFNGVLIPGFAVWVNQDPDSVDREARAGRFKAWGSPSEAIHEVFGDIVLQG